MKKYRRLQLTLTLLIMAYVIIGTTTWRWYQLEIFPIYSWDLFSYVPGHTFDYSIYIKAIDHNSLAEPVHFTEADTYFAETSSITAVVVFNKLGNAYEQDLANQVKQTRQQLESSYFANYDHVEYELVKRIYDPQIRWRTGEFITEESLTTFTYSK